MSQGRLGKWLIPLLAALSTLAAGPSEAAQSACDHLAAAVDREPGGAVFLPSYPTVDNGPLKGAAFLYDNAAATIALAACGKQRQARRIADAMVAALDHDRFWHDGRLRNAYLAGPVGDGPVKLPGWWDEGAKRWFEDRYQVGSDTGNMAWAMLALLSVEGEDTRYRAAALRIGGWVAGRGDPRGPGGFTGGTFGHEPEPQAIRWKSTEHNTDLAAAFGRLAERTGDPVWRERAQAAERLVEAMWGQDCACFAVGTGEDGVTRNPLLALDAQIWPLLALPSMADRRAAALATAERRLAVGPGFGYSEVQGGLWTEGTAQVALLERLLGRDVQPLERALAAQRAPQGGFFAASGPELPTGFMLPTDPTKPRLYYRVPHLGAEAWVALAEQGFNPFTGTRGLP
jgi:hypothetical protein